MAGRQKNKRVPAARPKSPIFPSFASRSMSVSPSATRVLPRRRRIHLGVAADRKRSATTGSEASRSLGEIDVETTEIIKRLTLRDVLADPVGIRYFSSHLRSELSHENIVFWRAVENLKRKWKMNSKENDETKLVAIATGLYKQFFKTGSSLLEINISEKVKKSVERIFNEGRVTVTMFDGAQEEVYRLMVDPFIRFKKSSSCLRFARAIKMRKQDRQAPASDASYSFRDNTNANVDTGILNTASCEALDQASIYSNSQEKVQSKFEDHLSSVWCKDNKSAADLDDLLGSLNSNTSKMSSRLVSDCNLLTHHSEENLTVLSADDESATTNDSFGGLRSPETFGKEIKLVLKMRRRPSRRRFRMLTPTHSKSLTIKDCSEEGKTHARQGVIVRRCRSTSPNILSRVVKNLN